MPISLPVPTADIGGALVKISASGPIPTSKYCDQASCSIRCALSRIAAAEPGWIFDRSVPMTPVMVRRIAAALLASPRACSSITRSSRLVAKVTPEAFSACRSHGARKYGDAASRWSWALLARIGARSPMRLPAARASATGSSAFRRSVMVGATRLRSNTPSSRIATMPGPGTSPGSHARPTSVPAVPSAGNAAAGVRYSCILASHLFRRRRPTARSAQPSESAFDSAPRPA